MNVAAGGTLNVGASGSLGASPLAITGGTASVTAATNLGSGAVSLNNANSTLLFNAGTGNTASYSGNSISLNGGEVHVASGSANLGDAAISATTYGVHTMVGLQGYYYQSVQGDPSGPIYNVTGNGGANVVALTQGAVINGVTPVSSVLTAAGSPNGTGLNFTNEGQINQQFNNPSGQQQFTEAFSGHFTAPTTGDYNFNVLGVDDHARLYIDTNNGTSFTLVAHQDCCSGSPSGGAPGTLGPSGTQDVSNIMLTAGQTISVAWTMEDNGGGSNFGVGYELPGNTNYTIVGPASSLPASGTNGTDTAGNPQSYWTYNSVSGGGTVAVDSGTSLTAGSLVNAQYLNLNGTLNLSSPAPTVSSAQNMAVGDNATLNLGANNTFNAGISTISDGKSLALTGPGTFSVTGTLAVGTSDATTAVNVNNGFFNVANGAVVSGPGEVNVNAGGSLGGPGTLDLQVNINHGGNLAPNDAANTTISSLTLNNGSILTYNLNTANVQNLTYSPAYGNDLTTVSGNNGLTLASNVGGTTLDILTTDPLRFERGTYELFAYTGTYTGNLDSIRIGSAPSAGYSLINVPGAGGGQIDLVVIPEPTSLVLAGLGLAAVGLRRRAADPAAKLILGRFSSCRSFANEQIIPAVPSIPGKAYEE